MSAPLEALLRKPIEFRSAAIMAVSAAVLVKWPGVFGQSGFTAALFATGLAALAIRRSRQGWNILRYQRNLKRLPFYEIAPEEIPLSQHRLFLGKGFRWTETHTQRLLDTRLPHMERFARPSKLYERVRELEWRYESMDWCQPVFKLTKAQKFGPIRNPIAPLPPVGGSPALHGVELNEEDVTMAMSERQGHTIVLGPPGVGKTRLMEVLVAQDIQRGDSVFMFDMKGDLALLLRAYAEAVKAGRADDFHVFHLGFPELSERYNPIGSFNRITEVPSRITSQLPGEGQSAAFREFVWRYGAVLSKAMYALGIVPTYKRVYESAVHIESLANRYFALWLDRDHPSWQADLDNLSVNPKEMEKQVMKSGRDQKVLEIMMLLREKEWHDPVADGLVSILANDRSYFDRLVSSLYPLLEKLTTGRVGDLVSPDYDDLEDIRPIFDWMQLINKKGSIIYCGFDALTDSEVAHAIGNSMFADLTSVAGQIYKFGTGLGQTDEILTPKIFVHADEFNESVGDEFIPLLNKARGAGFNVTAYTQTSDDIEAGIESAAKAEQIKGNFSNLIMFRAKNAATAAMLTDQLHEVAYKRVLPASKTSDENDPSQFEEFKSSTEDRVTERAVPMLTAADLANLPKGQCFASIDGGQLYKIRLPLFKPETDPRIPTSLAGVTAALRSRYESQARKPLMQRGSGSGY
jgi:conjugative coupling factor TraD (TOL family)